MKKYFPVAFYGERKYRAASAIPGVTAVSGVLGFYIPGLNTRNQTQNVSV
jgi:hypothetical protein